MWPSMPQLPARCLSLNGEGGRIGLARTAFDFAGGFAAEGGAAAGAGVFGGGEGGEGYEGEDGGEQVHFGMRF
jgi:hypothetical protein